MVRYIPQRFFFFFFFGSSLKMLFSLHVLYTVWAFCAMTQWAIYKLYWNVRDIINFSGKCLTKANFKNKHQPSFFCTDLIFLYNFFIPFVNNSYAEVSIKDNRRRENCFCPPILPRHGGSGEERACPPPPPQGWNFGHVTRKDAKKCHRSKIRWQKFLYICIFET